MLKIHSIHCSALVEIFLLVLSTYQPSLPSLPSHIFFWYDQHPLHTLLHLLYLLTFFFEMINIHSIHCSTFSTFSHFLRWSTSTPYTAPHLWRKLCSTYYLSTFSTFSTFSHFFLDDQHPFHTLLRTCGETFLILSTYQPSLPSLPYQPE